MKIYWLVKQKFEEVEVRNGKEKGNVGELTVTHTTHMYIVQAVQNK